MPARKEILESLAYRDLKVLCRKFEISLRKENSVFTTILTTKDEIIKEILKHDHPSKTEILEYRERLMEEREAKRGRGKAVRCINCKSTNVELKEIIQEGQTGWKASLTLPVSIERRSEKMQRTAIYFCRECKETFKRHVRGD